MLIKSSPLLGDLGTGFTFDLKDLQVSKIKKPKVHEDPESELIVIFTTRERPSR